MKSSPSFAPLRASLLVLAGTVVACAATSPTSTFGAGSGGAGSGGSGGSLFSGGGNGGGTGGGGIGTGGGSTTNTASGPPLIYAHTDSTLFKLDPTSPTLALTTLGDFDCIGGNGQDPAMTDFAVDKDLHLWGVSKSAVHPLTVQGSAVHCGAAVPLDPSKNVSFYALTFAPAGVLDPTKEVLVAGNTAGQLWAIDGAGNLSQHGTFGKVPNDDGNGNAYDNAGKEWELSGDIVFLANGGKPIGFATVRDCPSPPSTKNCNTVNTLIEIDVAKLGAATTQSVTKAVRGQIVKRQGCNDATQGDYGNMYGIAAWGSKVYGFSRSGMLVEIDTSDGTGCLVQAYDADKFSGAGVTTLAPIQPPTPK